LIRYGRSLVSLLKAVQVRLRIPAVLVASGLIIGQWDAVRNRWDKWTRPASADSAAAHAVSTDTEYFCPMDPGVLSDWPGKCGVCNMGLVRRKKGDATPLPNGVVARMQISPYRVQLAGVRTLPVEYRPLARELTTGGVIHRDGDRASLRVELSTRDAGWIVAGSKAVVTSGGSGREPCKGRVDRVEPARDDGARPAEAVVVVDDPARALQAGEYASATIERPMAELDPFATMPRKPPAILPGEKRTAWICPQHPEIVETAAGRCAVDSVAREPRPLTEYQRVRYWCPMHPKVVADKPGAVCDECGGMVLKPRIVSFSPEGQVLAAPLSAVVQTGSKSVVYVETMPGMFQGVEVVLGPRCGELQPVVSGLEAGQRVVARGAFLLDAETRLNPSLAAAYFGAGPGATARTPTTTATTEAVEESPIAQLGAADRALAEKQKICPVTKKPLGSMGVPARVEVAGKVVFVCCEGCEHPLKKNPAKYLAKSESAPAAVAP
jgi:membrane fusion protein, copper/silver efflux system